MPGLNALDDLSAAGAGICQLQQQLANIRTMDLMRRTGPDMA